MHYRTLALATALATAGLWSGTTLGPFGVARQVFIQGGPPWCMPLARRVCMKSRIFSLALMLSFEYSSPRGFRAKAFLLSTSLPAEYRRL